jgi:uncharacterized membrane protein (DUF2068 family)
MVWIQVRSSIGGRGSRDVVRDAGMDLLKHSGGKDRSPGLQKMQHRSANLDRYNIEHVAERVDNVLAEQCYVGLWNVLEN